LVLIEEILDLSKLESQNLELHEQQTLLSVYLQRIFAAFESEAQYQDIDYKLDYKLDSNLAIDLDRNKTAKIINNLLSNAFKFTSAKGSIKLIVGRSDDYLNIEVQDSGKGIHPDDIDFVFDRFYQARKEVQIAEGGTGIGLSLSKELAELMNGSLRVESTLGEGTSFYLTIPMKEISISHQEKVEVEAVVETEEVVLNKEFTVLLVEDNHDMRNFVGGLLLPHYQLLTAANGKKALELLKTNVGQVHLIISDIMMPEMDGFELLDCVKKDDDLRNTPVIMLTARTEEEDKLQALTVGVDDYLTKPFSVQELLARTKNLLFNYQERLLWQSQNEEAQSSELVVEAKELDSELGEAVSEVEQQWVKEVETYVKSKIDEEFDNDLLAQQFNQSKRHFSRKLKKVTGLPPAKFVKEIRLQVAREHLERGKFLSVSEVAYTVGFLSVSTFSKAFSKRFGRIPSSYF